MNQIRLGLFSLVFLVGFNQRASCQVSEADCLEVNYHDKCAGNIKHVFDDFALIKSRPFGKQMEDMIFTITMRSNILYVFDLCEGADQGASIVLYDEDDNVIVSTHDGTSKSRVLTYMSESTTKYGISVHFSEETKATCAVVLFGMIRKNIEAYHKK